MITSQIRSNRFKVHPDQKINSYYHVPLEQSILPQHNYEIPIFKNVPMVPMTPVRPSKIQKSSYFHFLSKSNNKKNSFQHQKKTVTTQYSRLEQHQPQSFRAYQSIQPTKMKDHERGRSAPSSKRRSYYLTVVSRLPSFKPLKRNERLIQYTYKQEHSFEALKKQIFYLYKY